MPTQTDVKKTMARFTSNVPPFPKTARRVMDLLRDPGIQLTKIGSVVALDQGLAGRVLRLANSAYFGIPQQVNSVRDAIVLLGLANVRNVLISASVGHIFLRGLDCYGVEEGRFWEHSVGTAYAAQMMSRKVDTRTYSMAFSSGLVHDVGKVAIDLTLKQAEKRDFLNLLREENELQAERDVAGMTHPEIGKAICERWNLPPEMTAAVAFHHDPTQAPEAKNLPRIVASSNLCANLVLGGGAELRAADLETGVPGCHVPDEATLRRIQEDLPGTVGSSRELITGVSEVLEGPAEPKQQ
jgi:HD-like signal output (HDOD) protein